MEKSPDYVPLIAVIPSVISGMRINRVSVVRKKNWFGYLQLPVALLFPRFSRELTIFLVVDLGCFLPGLMDPAGAIYPDFNLGLASVGDNCSAT